MATNGIYRRRGNEAITCNSATTSVFVQWSSSNKNYREVFIEVCHELTVCTRIQHFKYNLCIYIHCSNVNGADKITMSHTTPEYYPILCGFPDVYIYIMKDLFSCRSCLLVALTISEWHVVQRICLIRGLINNKPRMSKCLQVQWSRSVDELTTPFLGAYTNFRKVFSSMDVVINHVHVYISWCWCQE